MANHNFFWYQIKDQLFRGGKKRKKDRDKKSIIPVF
jgi:hypothetical protein